MFRWCQSANAGLCARRSGVLQHIFIIIRPQKVGSSVFKRRQAAVFCGWRPVQGHDRLAVRRKFARVEQNLPVHLDASVRIIRSVSLLCSNSQGASEARFTGVASKSSFKASQCSDAFQRVSVSVSVSASVLGPGHLTNYLKIWRSLHMWSDARLQNLIVIFFLLISFQDFLMCRLSAGQYAAAAFGAALHRYCTVFIV